MKTERKFIRHPANIPIEFNILGKRDRDRKLTKNISLGGLCFQSHACVENDVTLSIQIPVTRPKFRVEGRVVWCSIFPKYVEIGVEFFNPADLHKTRMIEQICHIKQYQKNVLENEGRQLSDEKAALEWIDKFANEFPN